MITVEKILLGSDFILLLIALCSIVVFIKIQIRKEYDIKKILTLEVTEQLKGIAITCVLLHHLAQRVSNLYWIKVFVYVGHISVGLFLFISGYSIAVSFDSKKNYLTGFLRKRIRRVYIPFVFMNIVAIIYLYLSGEFISSFFSILGVNLIDKTQWFIFCILLFYLFFWVALHLANSLMIGAYLLLIFVVLYIFALRYYLVDYYWYVSSLAFPAGVFVYQFRCNISKLLKEKYVFYMFMALFLFSFALGDLLGRWYFSIVASVLYPFVFLFLLSRIQIESYYLHFAGAISLEIYILHMKVLYLFYGDNNNEQSNIYLVLCIVVIFVASYLYKIIYENLFKK